MRASMTSALRERGLHAGAVNNEQCWPGTPDIYYRGIVPMPGPSSVRHVLDGWCEQKYLRAFPKRANTSVRFPCYTLKQREWHTSFSDAGGKITVLALVKRDWFLFDGNVAARGRALHVPAIPRLGDMTARQMHEAALVHWTGAFDLDKILEWL